MGPRSPHLWNGCWLPSILCRSAHSDLREDRVWEGRRAFFKVWNVGHDGSNQTHVSTGRRNVLKKPKCLLLPRFDSRPTSAPTWRTCWGTCCRWIWPNATATWRTESTTSRATSGLPRPTGSRSTRERQDAAHMLPWQQTPRLQKRVKYDLMIFTFLLSCSNSIILQDNNDNRVLRLIKVDILLGFVFYWSVGSVLTS